MRKQDVNVGMHVTCKESVEASAMFAYRKYRTIESGMVGTITGIDIPSVTHNRTFCNAEFRFDDGTYRACLLYPNIRKVRTT